MPLNVENVMNYCRLCQLRLGIIKIVMCDDFVGKVFECTKIKIDEQINLLPQGVCETCKSNIESFFKFIQDTRQVDQNLRCALTNKQNCVKNVDNISETLSDNVNSVKKEFAKTPTNQHKCPVCSKVYKKYKNFQYHKRSHLELFCPRCKTVFDSNSECQQHVCEVNFEPQGTNVSNPKDLTKEKCSNNKKITRKSIVTDELQEKIELPDYNEDFSEPSTTGSELHLPNCTTVDCKIKSNEVSDNYSCSSCDKKFLWNEDFLIHQKKHETNFVCTYQNCKKVCTSAYSLKTHQMKHEGKRPFLCVTCGKSFITKNSLNCHEKIHLEVKAYTCKLCNIGFSVPSNLRAHEKKHHEGVRFYCSQCTRAFITKYSLERHELVHTGIKEFKCSSCPAAFYTNKELLKHQKYHQGLRQYKCDKCFKTFFEKHHLTIHLRVHSGERPYICKIDGCGKSFTESQKLTRHMKARHRYMKTKLDVSMNN